MEKFQVKVGEFEGPIEVLLGLIEEKKLHISQVSLAAVADDFVNHLQKLDQTSKAQIANFILVAATLMLIKSISLLPALEVTPEEEESIGDLERRLKLYRRLKELSVQVKERFGNRVIFGREAGRELVPVFSPTAEITTPNLLAAIKNLIQNFPKPEILPQVIIQKILSLEEVIKDLSKRVQSALKMSFRDFVKDKKEKVNIIVSFLGLLELVKQGIVSVEQSAHFGDIAMETTDPTEVPRYGA